MPDLRYAVLWHHDVAEPHYDVMFETLPGSQLATWRVSRWPIEQRVEAKRLRDHRRFYLEFEGDLSDSRGRVERVAGGACTVNVLEASVFEVRFLNGTSSIGLRLSPAEFEAWSAEPLR